MSFNIELFNVVPLSEEELRLLEKVLRRALRHSRAPLDVLFVSVVESHDQVREVLDVKKMLDYEEKPVKLFIDYDTLQPVLSVRIDALRRLSPRELELEIARELTTYEVIVDPIHVPKWAIPESISTVTPLDAMLSTAMILRTVDSLLVERGYAEQLARDFELTEINGLANIADSERYTSKVRAVQALSWDLPLSFELVNKREIGERLFLEALKRVITEQGRKFTQRYDDFRAYSRNNFYYENVHEYLDLVFTDET